MSKKIKKIMLLISIIILVVLVIAYLYINPHYWMPRSSLKLNIWALTRWSNQLDLTVYEKNIQSHGSKALPYLEECIKKYQNNNEYKKAERCSIVIDSIKHNSSK